MQITILTATYNRAHLLPDLYASLCRQRSKAFTWFIVDDGSEDNTKEMVTGWMQKGHDFEIEYHYIQNGGKNRAINYGVKHINTPYTMIVDSDDYLTDDAIEYLTPKAIEVLKDETIAGISTLKGDKEESPLQQPRFGDRDYITANNLEIANYGLERDACEVYNAQPSVRGMGRRKIRSGRDCLEPNCIRGFVAALVQQSYMHCTLSGRGADQGFFQAVA